MISKDELNRIAADDEAVLHLAELSEAELSDLLGEHYAAMKDFKQDNPHHCYNLLEHILYTAAALKKNGFGDDDFLKLRIAALFHDIAKPDVAMRKGDKTVFYGHAKKSAEVSDLIFEEMGYDSEYRRFLWFLIENHDLFLSFKLPEEIYNPSNPYIKAINRENVLAQIEAVQRDAESRGLYVPEIKDFVLTVNLSMADAKAQSEIVVQNGKVIDSRQRKLERYEKILAIVNELK